MNIIKLPVDTTYGRREVQFNGIKLITRTVRKPNDNTKGATETDYRVEGQRLITHIAQWTDQPDNIQCYVLTERGEPDLPPPPSRSEPEYGRPIELDEALSLSLSPVWRV